MTNGRFFLNYKEMETIIYLFISYYSTKFDFVMQCGHVGHCLYLPHRKEKWNPKRLTSNLKSKSWKKKKTESNFHKRIDF